MKNYEEVIGIDVSKKTVDAFCCPTHAHKVFSTHLKGYESLLHWVLKVSKTDKLFYCFEITGYYSLGLPR